MYHQQGDFIRLADDQADPPHYMNHPAARHKLIFATFLNALHESRRLQAMRAIHQHRHLIVDVRGFKEAYRPPERLTDGNSNIAIYNDCRARRPSISLNAWTAATVVAFGIMLAISGIMLSVPNAGPTETSSVAKLHGDR